MGPPRFELESEDPQSPRMPGYPTIPLHYLVSLPDILGFPYGFGKMGGFVVVGTFNVSLLIVVGTESSYARGHCCNLGAS